MNECFNTFWRRNVLIGALCYLLTSSIVLIGVIYGVYQNGNWSQSDFIEAVFQWDARSYREIAQSGYHYRPGAGSTIAFFPAYPMAAKSLSNLSGLSVEICCILTAQVFLLASFVVMAAYATARLEDNRGGALNPVASVWSQETTIATLLAFGLVPTSFFFRMPYTESMFLFFTLVAFYGMARQWPPIYVAFVVGWATATRSIGIALVPPLAIYAWNFYANRSIYRFIAACTVGCCGLLAFMLYQYLKFDTPLAFMRAQDAWTIGPPISLSDKVISLFSWEPVWSVYVPNEFGYRGWADEDGGVLSLQFANPILFVGTAALIGFGWFKNWLTKYELLYSVGVLAVSYTTRAVEMGFNSQGRYAAVVFPAYIVVGRIYSAGAKYVLAALSCLSAFILAKYTASFVIGLPLF